MGILLIKIGWSSYFYDDASCYSCYEWNTMIVFNSSPPRQNGRHFTDDTLKRIFLNDNIRIAIKIPLQFVPKGPINNILALV